MELLRARLPWRRSNDEDEGGFTLIELVVAIGLIGIVFAAVAGIMTSSLRTLAIQKARTQGNEVATQAIEDLQRRNFDDLVLCSTPSGTPPAGLDDIVHGPACPSPVSSSYGEDPCNSLNPLHAPKAEYSCTRINITYNVKRYIAWVDAGHTSKRLAVFVTWEDAVGIHSVSQQSSLRAPSAQSVIGLANPTLYNPVVDPVNQLDEGGILQNPVGVTVDSTYLTSTDDRVFVKFSAINDEGAMFIESVLLTKSGDKFLGSIPAGFRFGAGSQFITFNAVRAVDGKTTATVSSEVRFCKGSDPSCLASTLPAINNITVSPTPIVLSASGGVQANFTISALTHNVPATGRVQAMLNTLAGVEAIDMVPQDGCETGGCTWVGVVEKSKGYSFQSGSGSVYVSAAQPYVAGSTTDQGSTTSKSATVSFT